MEKCKILVVDDESRMRKLVRDFLVKKDFEVLHWTFFMPQRILPF